MSRAGKSLIEQSLIKVVLAAFLTSVGAWFIMDSLTFELMPFDPETGRAKGCYTWLEDAFGAKEPSDGLRLIQLLVGGTMIFSVPAAMVWSAIRRKRLRRAETRN